MAFTYTLQSPHPRLGDHGDVIQLTKKSIRLPVRGSARWLEKLLSIESFSCSGLCYVPPRAHVPCVYGYIEFDGHLFELIGFQSFSSILESLKNGEALKLSYMYKATEDTYQFSVFTE
jgi:hypothetical protein